MPVQTMSRQFLQAKLSTVFCIMQDLNARARLSLYTTYFYNKWEIFSECQENPTLFQVYSLTVSKKTSEELKCIFNSFPYNALKSAGLSC